LFNRLREGDWTAVISNHLLLDYEEVLKRNAIELRLSLDDLDQLLNAICARAEVWPLAPGWGPLLRDPDDEPLTQLAWESGAQCVITYNLLRLKPETALGIEFLKLRDSGQITHVI